MPHSRNVLVTSGSVRVMLICSSSYAIRGFSYILLFTFYADNYVNHISCSAGNILVYWEGFTGICIYVLLDDNNKI